MTATEQDVEMWQGDDITLRFTVSTDDGLTGATVEWAMSAAPLSAASTAAVSKAGEVTDAAAGICTVTLAAADTADLEPGRYYHELDVIDPQGNRSTVATGHVTLRRALLK